jgi:hypothetical protein
MKSKKIKGHGNSVVSRVRKYFPNVTQVVDATDSITVSVQKSDVKSGRRNQPGSCALAQACVREYKADGALINIGFSYIIKGETATRYKTSVSVGREITSFDRHHDFATGNDYMLSKVSPASRLDRKRPGHSGPKGNHLTTAPKPTVHRTVRIRKATR